MTGSTEGVSGRRVPGGLLASGAALGIGLGAALAVAPLAGVAVLAGLLALAAGARLGWRLGWGALLTVLLGYQLAGKGFAYMGVPPVYVGEIALGLGLVAAAFCLPSLVRRGPPAGPGRIVAVPLLAFLAWQAACTVPYLGRHGLDTLRDAVTWGYATFALIVWLIVPPRAVTSFFRFQCRFLPFYLAWLPVALSLGKVGLLEASLSHAPVPIILLRSGDVGFQLAGVATLLLLRCDRFARRRPWSTPTLWGLWLFWVVGWVIYGVSNRAGALAALCGLLLAAAWAPRSRWDRPLVVAVVLISGMLLSGLRIEYQRGAQDLSAQQLVANAMSLVGEGEGVLQRTKEWRLSWWRRIASETFTGPHRWTGRGYGVDLGLVHGVHDGTGPHQPRSPHSVHATILARSGVPGLVLWVAFVVSLMGLLLRQVLRPRPDDPERTAIACWILALLVGILIAASFGVTLEGPMAGIWFWSLVGMALLRLGGSEPAGPEHARSGASPRPSSRPAEAA